MAGDAQCAGRWGRLANFGRLVHLLDEAALVVLDGSQLSREESVAAARSDEQASMPSAVE